MRLPLVGVVLAITANSAAAQQLASRLAAMRDGTIRISFATRAEVCGDGQFIGIDTPRGFRMYTFHGGGSSSRGYSSEILQDVQPECSGGPMRLVVEKTAGRVTDLRVAVGVAWRRAAGVTDLGTISAPDVAAWLLDNVATLDDDLLAVAFVAAMAADSARVTDRLLALAKTRTLPAAARAQALRWLTDASAREGKPATADETLRAIVRDEGDVATVRDRAVRELDRTPANDAFLRDAYRVSTQTALKERVIRRVAESDTPENVAWLRALVLDPRESTPLRDRALRSLGEELKRRAEVEALYARLDEPSLKVRALRVIAQSGDSAGLARLRAIALSETEPVEVRDQAIRVLADGRDEATTRWLQSLVTGTGQPIQIRDRAIRVLAERREVDFLQQAYRRVDAVPLKDRIIRSVAEVKGTDARSWLSGIAANAEESTDLRDRAIRLLAERGAPSADIAGLYDRVTAGSLRQRIVRILAERGDDAAVDKLTLIADKDPDPEMRRYALRRLGATRSTRARAFLERRI